MTREAGQARRGSVSCEQRIRRVYVCGYDACEMIEVGMRQKEKTRQERIDGFHDAINTRDEQERGLRLEMGLGLGLGCGHDELMRRWIDGGGTQSEGTCKETNITLLRLLHVNYFEGISPSSLNSPSSLPELPAF